MSKHNYTQYSNKKSNNVSEPDTNVAEEVKMEVEPVVCTGPIVIEPVNETVETFKPVIGKVTNCAKLNVRVAPTTDADIECVLPANTEVEINVAKSTDEWFSICTATGVVGYCMKRFVATRL